MPPMMDDAWRQIKELFAEALQRPPPQRDAFLDDTCRYAEVRAQVEELLTPVRAASV